jgi:hypothetical protein
MGKKLLFVAAADIESLEANERLEEDFITVLLYIL